MALQGLYQCFSHWGKNGGAFIIGDTHFGESDLKKAFPNRPSDEELVKMINQKVGKCGTLILLGDVGDLEYAKKLKGYKILVCGNHDRGHTAYREIFNEVYEGPVLISSRILLSHEPVPNMEWCMNIHAHVHDARVKIDKYHFNTCADRIGYTPINFNQWLKDGHLSHLVSTRRRVIDNATERKKKRGGRKIGEK